MYLFFFSEKKKHALLALMLPNLTQNTFLLMNCIGFSQNLQQGLKTISICGASIPHYSNVRSLQ